MARKVTVSFTQGEDFCYSNPIAESTVKHLLTSLGLISFFHLCFLLTYRENFWIALVMIWIVFLFLLTILFIILKAIPRWVRGTADGLNLILGWGPEVFIPWEQVRITAKPHREHSIYQSSDPIYWPTQKLMAVNGSRKYEIPSDMAALIRQVYTSRTGREIPK